MICQKCNHAWALHCGENGECQVRQLQSGYPDFASLPVCGCTAKKEIEDDD